MVEQLETVERAHIFISKSRVRNGSNIRIFLPEVLIFDFSFRCNISIRNQ